jgi:hypothetical protein
LAHFKLFIHAEVRREEDQLVQSLAPGLKEAA